MNTRFVSIDRETPMLLPPDLREWVADDDPVHFVIEAVNLTPTESFWVNRRGCGSAQYPPSMMLALLVYCYSMGIFGSRRIEQATYRDVSVRYLTGDTHPDHDTICTFRRRNGEAIRACMKSVLTLAAQLGLARVGTVSVDGTHIKANASKYKNVTYGRAVELEQQLDLEIAELEQKAEQADQSPVDGERLPRGLGYREGLRDKMRSARQQMQARERQEQEAKQAARHDKPGPNDGSGPPPKSEAKPAPEPKPDTRHNLTDPDSRLMRKTNASAYEQSYNGQLAVDADGAQLIYAARLTQHSTDNGELGDTLDAIPQALGRPENALADSGYASQKDIETVEATGTAVYMQVSRDGRRKYDYRPQPPKPPAKSAIAKSPFGQRMIALLSTDTGKALYARRKQSVETVFGIIKKNMRFTQLSLRGLQNATLEWELIALTYNIARIHTLKRQQQNA